jgi:Protein of unknown function (DUF1579)
MKRPSMWVVCAIALLLSTVVMAQAPGKVPTPGPEHKRLGYFVGKWTGAGEMKASPFGAGGKMTWSETCEWFSGNFAIVCRSDMKGPMGDGKGLSIMAYDTEEKDYVYFGVTSIGEVETSRGTLKGRTWNWAGEGKAQGKPLKLRFSVDEKTSDVYSFKFEISQDAGKTWSVVTEGENTRAK